MADFFMPETQQTIIVNDPLCLLLKFLVEPEGIVSRSAINSSNFIVWSLVWVQWGGSSVRWD